MGASKKKTQKAVEHTGESFPSKQMSTKAICKSALSPSGGVKKRHSQRGTSCPLQHNCEKGKELLISQVPFQGVVAHEDEDDHLGPGEFLVGVMFGNVDGAGNLEEEYFDQVAKDNLHVLSSELGPYLEDLQVLGKEPGTSLPAEDEDWQEDYDSSRGALQHITNCKRNEELLIPEVRLQGLVAQEDEKDHRHPKEFFVGVMFGNVDGAGNLEEDYFDQDAIDYLYALSSELSPSLVDLQIFGKEVGTSLLANDDWQEDYDNIV